MSDLIDSAKYKTILLPTSTDFRGKYAIYDKLTVSSHQIVFTLS